MKDAIHCSFCSQPESEALALVASQRTSAVICDTCLKVCETILVKSGTEPIVDTPKSHYRIGAPKPERGQLSCSFCGAPQHKAHRLIGTPKGLPQAYICDECVAVCQKTAKR